MKWIASGLFAVVVLTMPVIAVADCYHNGQRVAEGTRIGPMVCENGRWEYRP